MTIQEAKDFLNRGYRSRERIKVKEERIDEWIRRADLLVIAKNVKKHFGNG